MKVVLFLIAAAACCNPVHDVLVMPSGDVCVLRSGASDSEAADIELIMLSPSGRILWQEEITSVRTDAAGGVLCLTGPGNILCACEEGLGYTDILIGTYSPSGDVLNTDTISRECYDSPQGISTVDQGILLAWDSWSEERGIHLALLGESGAVEGSEFIAGTLHPMSIAMDHRGGTTVLGVSPVAAENDVLFGLSQEGSVLWSTGFFPEDAMVIHDVAVEESGDFSVLWGTVPVGTDGSSLILTRFSAGGAVTDQEIKPFESIGEISAVNLLSGGKALVVSNSIRLLEVDLYHGELMEIELSPCHAYSNVIRWNAVNYILFGLDGLEAFNRDGQHLFRI